MSVDKRSKVARAASFLACGALLITAAAAQPGDRARATPVAVATDTAVQRAKQLLAQMTVAEKIGQLNLASAVPLGPGMTGLSDDDVIQGKAGAVLYQARPKEINRLQHLAVEKSRLHIPILFGLDVVHGFRTAFPIPLAMASSWDPSVEETVQRFAGVEAKAAGIRWVFTPMVDIARDARWGRIAEGAGEDAFLGAAMARAQVHGFQGESLEPGSVIACVKHFAGYGAADGGRDYDSVSLSEELLHNVYLVPFQAAVQAGVGSVMSAYMDLNDVPASGNKVLLTDLLRKEMGFKGFVTSDAGAIASLQVHGFAADQKDAALKAMAAGAGMDMMGQAFTTQLPALITSGRVSVAQLDAAVLPILEEKIQVGLFDHPYVDESAVATGLSPAGIALARSSAERSLVLLKNDKGTLPLSPARKKIAVIGVLADSESDVSGGGGGANFFDPTQKTSSVTVLAALKRRFGAEAQIEYVPGPALPRLYPSSVEGFLGIPPAKPASQTEIDNWIEKTKAAAAQADVVIAVVGETSFMSGEAASRATLDLPGIQRQMEQAAAASGKPLITVLQNGRPLDIRWEAEHSSAILESWMLGVEGGTAVVNVLFGDVNPGGKLPLSWPRSAGQEPLYYDHNLTQAPDSDPNFGSRYWDESSKPLFPFGYGLSFSLFKFANLRTSRKTMGVDGSLEVSVDVTNEGSVAGDTVAQLYLHQQSGSASRPVRQLKGFRRISLQPGQTVTTTFKVGPDELRFWSGQLRDWVVDPARYDLWVGEDSTATLHADFSVDAP